MTPTHPYRPPTHEIRTTAALPAATNGDFRCYEEDPALYTRYESTLPQPLRQSAGRPRGRVRPCGGKAGNSALSKAGRPGQPVGVAHQNLEDPDHALRDTRLRRRRSYPDQASAAAAVTADRRPSYEGTRPNASALAPATPGCADGAATHVKHQLLRLPPAQLPSAGLRRQLSGRAHAPQRPSPARTHSASAPPSSSRGRCSLRQVTWRHRSYLLAATPRPSFPPRCR
jgi:hypothetical protein